MGSVIISMPRSEDASRIADMLNRHGMRLDTEICQTASEVLQKAGDRDFGVVICTGRVNGMSSVELEEYLPGNFGMVLLTKNADTETYSEKTVKLLMPFKTSDLLAAVETVVSPLIRKSGKKSLEERHKRSAIDQQVIDDAKALLMEKKGMTEPEAFRFIQKTSMDTGRNMVESARMVLALY